MTYQIISDGSCDLTKQYVEKNDIVVVPFYVSFDGENYLKEGIEVDHDDFYNKMIDEHAFPKSSLPSVQDYIDAFTPIVKEGKPIICICITEKFSGSYQSATNAANMVKEEYPDAKITVINSMVNTVLQGILVNEIVRMRDNGLSYENTIEKIKEIIPTGRIVFTLANIEYLKQGGRIGKLLMFASDKLGIKPLITLKEGEIFPSGITRNRAKSIKKVVEITKSHFEKNRLNPKDYQFCIGTGITDDEAKELAKMIEDELNITIDFWDVRIGTTIGTHTGPYPIGTAFIKKYDR
ncbi:MAG: DegV family protein [Lachnospiraceae bacterium]|nr:DegV family protein [Lachnospiraceae bacterium]